MPDPSTESDQLVHVQCSGVDCTEETQIDVSSGTPKAKTDGWNYGPNGWRCSVCDELPVAKAPIAETQTIEQPIVDSSAPVDEMLDLLRETIDAIGQHNAGLKALKQIKDRIERELIRRCRDEGAGTTFENDQITCRVKEKPRAGYDPERWGDIIRFLGENDLQDLVERRLNATKIKSLSEDGTPMPDGVWLESVDFCSSRRK